jgi:hypothetical protein
MTLIPHTEQLTQRIAPRKKSSSPEGIKKKARTSLRKSQA